jgi:hypothetical protein
MPAPCQKCGSQKVTILNLATKKRLCVECFEGRMALAKRLEKKVPKVQRIH